MMAGVTAARRTLGVFGPDVFRWDECDLRLHAEAKSFRPSKKLSARLGTATVCGMKASALNDGRFVTDAKGRTVGVLLDVKTYERLREAEEDLADIRAYDNARPKVLAETKLGQVASLSEYRRLRKQ